MAQLSPMMTQYLNIKEKYKDCILFFRLGDFYEMFFEDALLVSKELELTLTGKNCGLDERAPMCGVPYHSASTYIQKLVDNGHKVAICEQLSDPSLTKGIVERDVVRIISKGTIVDSNLLDESQNHFIVAVVLQGKKAGISYCDISTGEFFAYTIESYEKFLKDEILRINPKEVLVSDNKVINLFSEENYIYFNDAKPYLSSHSVDVLLKHFNLQSIDDFHLDTTLALKASSVLFSYIKDTQKIELSHITNLKQYFSRSNLYLDNVTRSNLELSNSLRYNSKKGSLLGVLDKTCTAMGARQLKAWVDQPLANKLEIENRLNAVELLFNNFIVCDSIKESLNNVYDLERILCKISYKTLNPRDCLAILRSLIEVPKIINILKNYNETGFLNIINSLDPLQDLCELIEKSIDPEANIALSEGGYIRLGFNSNLDELRQASKNAKKWLLELEEKERETTGIKNLKIAYNKIFGYYFEITKSNLGLVPLRYIRKQTLTNSERFTTQELQDIEHKVLNSVQLANKLENEIFDEIKNIISTVILRIQQNASALKQLDALISLACVAQDNHYVKPTLNNNHVLNIQGGRHPVVEASLKNTAFVKNDVFMNNTTDRTLIITGPNMSGKSTFMRQNAIIAIMAHIGSFVPADAANICVFDRIFTRIGASDNLSEGQSTFMVEMSQTANILKNATENSLVILDEIGRGTSTFDGLSIAWAVVEYLTSKIGAKTLFATHYHELADLEGHLDGVKNYCVSIKEFSGEVIFLHKIVHGSIDKSYGIHVAKLAGLPLEVLKLSNKILAKLEAAEINNNFISQNIIGNNNKTPVQYDLFHTKHNEFVEEIKQIDVMSLTPMQSMEILFKLSEKANKL